MEEYTHNADMAKVLHAIEDQAAEIRELREEIKPLLEIYQNANGAYTVLLWILKTLTAFGVAVGAYLVIKNFTK